MSDSTLEMVRGFLAIIVGLVICGAAGGLVALIGMRLVGEVIR